MTRPRISTLLAALVAVVDVCQVAGTYTRDEQQKPITDQPLHNKNPFTEDFVKFVDETLDDWKVAGLSIAVIDGDDVFSKGFGYATLPDEPATPKTLWYAGSTTKAFTTAALAQLIDSGQYPELSQGWQTPISSLIHDDFVLQDAWATNHLTLEDAACHRTGQTENDMGILRYGNGHPWKSKDVVRNMRNFPLGTSPRTSFRYNNEMYATLSHVVETLTGKWIGDVFQEMFWDPLGMNSTYLDLQQAKDASAHLSHGYFWNETSKTHESLEYMPTGPIGGAGAVISSVTDYTRWIRSLLRQNGPLSKKVHQEIRTPRFIENARPALGLDVSLYGLAWWRNTILGQVVYWHSGTVDTHGTLIYWLPDLDYGVIIMMNRGSRARQVLMRRLIEDKLGVSGEERFDMSGEQKKAQRDIREDVGNATQILYPNRPKVPLPPSLIISKFEGSYHAAGFGTYKFTSELDNAAPGGAALVAIRTDQLWMMELRLHHVSGDFWTAYATMLNSDREVLVFMAVDFHIGIDGEAYGMDVTLTDRMHVNDGKVFFRKVES